MILLILGKDQDVIEIHPVEIICVRVEDEVHDAREHWRSINKAERHDSIFIRTIACSECCLGDILFTNANLVITHMEVKLVEYLGTFKLLEKLIDVGKWVLALYCLLVQWMVVDVESFRSILLHKEDITTPWR